MDFGSPFFCVQNVSFDKDVQNIPQGSSRFDKKHLKQLASIYFEIRADRSTNIRYCVDGDSHIGHMTSKFTISATYCNKLVLLEVHKSLHHFTKVLFL